MRFALTDNKEYKKLKKEIKMRKVNVGSNFVSYCLKAKTFQQVNREFPEYVMIIESFLYYNVMQVVYYMHRIYNGVYNNGFVSFVYR
jgi:hypothetical protein